MKKITVPCDKRIQTGIWPFDCVLGGGLVSGSTIILSGARGTGKTTFLLQVAGNISKFGGMVVYASAEQEKEFICAMSKRHKRLYATNKKLIVVGCDECDGNIENILAVTKKTRAKLLIVDSINTMYVEGVEGAVGQSKQLMAVANCLVKFARDNNVAVIFIAHLNAKGKVAGPNALRHLVDVEVHLQDTRFSRDWKGTERLVSVHAEKNRHGELREDLMIFDEKGFKPFWNEDENG